MFIPDKIVIEDSIKDLPYTQKILSRLGGIPVESIKNINDLKKDSAQTFKNKTLLITDYKGDLIKKCPGSKGVLCCNYYVANLVNGCPFACSYCILQDYLNCSSVMVCANIDKFFEELDGFARDGNILRLGTGELADSLAFDDILNLTDELLPGIKKYPNVMLELKTKSDCVDNLLNHDPCDQVVVSWSLNPYEISELDECGTATIDQRFEAAKKIIGHGYKVAFHFDPMIQINDWQKKYAEILEKLFCYIPSERIVWVSLGTLRFSASLKKTIRENHPDSKILSYGEHVICQDGKFRYFRPIRVKMYREMVAMIDQYDSNLPVYLCMETDQVWKEVFGSLPCKTGKLDLIYKRIVR